MISSSRLGMHAFYVSMTFQFSPKDQHGEIILSRNRLITFPYAAQKGQNEHVQGFPRLQSVIMGWEVDKTSK